MSSSSRQIINLSDLSTEWNCIREPFKASFPDWHHCSSTKFLVGRRFPYRDRIARIIATREAMRLVQHHSCGSVVVTHGPRPTCYWATLASSRREDVTQLAFSFNFTELPTGAERWAMSRAFRHVARFVVFSVAERDLYSSHFGIDPASVDMLHWGANPPAFSRDASPRVQGEYICAIGGQARDYPTLVAAMKLLPRIRLVVVATPESIANIVMPANVEVRTNISYSDAMNVLAYSRFMVLPLLSSMVRCGHVTAVSAMHLSKAIVATDAIGLHDYLRDKTNALLVPPSRAREMADANETLFLRPEISERLGASEGDSPRHTARRKRLQPTSERSWLNCRQRSRNPGVQTKVAPRTSDATSVTLSALVPMFLVALHERTAHAASIAHLGQSAKLDPLSTEP